MKTFRILIASFALLAVMSVVMPPGVMAAGYSPGVVDNPHDDVIKLKIDNESTLALVNTVAQHSTVGMKKSEFVALDVEQKVITVAYAKKRGVDFGQYSKPGFIHLN